MTTRAELRELSSSAATLRGLLARDLRELIEGLPDDPAVARAILQEVVPGLVSTYGDAAASLAAEWFEDVYKMPALLAEPTPFAAAARTAAWAARDLESSGVASGALGTSVDGWVTDQVRLTVRDSAASHRMKYARVPSGAKTCAFCLMLASRGPVYASSKAAAGLDRFHGRCDCQVVASEDDDDLPEGYDYREMYDFYKAARAEAGSGDPKDILAAMRRMGGDTLTDGIKSHAP